MVMLRLIVILFLILTSLAVASGQSRRPPSAPVDATQNRPHEPDPLGPPELEMMARREVELLEHERRENLQHAREAAQLGAEIRSAFTQNHSLSRDELKKLDRLEKLTRKILSDAGGSNTDEAETNIPTQLEAAVNRIAELSEEIRKTVEKTPRQVVAAGVIEDTNKLLDIIRRVRELNR